MANLIWSDECDGPAGPIDVSKWTVRTGGRWGNGAESQTYTARPENIRYNGHGQMELTARRERYTGTDGVTRDYTSARIDTSRRFHLTKGYVEFRALIPYTVGLWPQLWTYAEPWPDGGELDLHESVMGDQRSHQTVHAEWGQAGWGGAGERTLDFTVPHTYGCYFDEREVQFYIDGEKTLHVPRREPWPFGTTSQFLVINMSVGRIGGDPAKGVWPQTMLIDHVRVYDTVPTSTPSPPPVVPTPPAPDMPDEVEQTLTAIRKSAKSRADYYAKRGADDNGGIVVKRDTLVRQFRALEKRAGITLDGLAGDVSPQ